MKTKKTRAKSSMSFVRHSDKYWTTNPKSDDLLCWEAIDALWHVPKGATVLHLKASRRMTTGGWNVRLDEDRGAVWVDGRLWQMNDDIERKIFRVFGTKPFYVTCYYE